MFEEQFALYTVIALALILFTGGIKVVALDRKKIKARIEAGEESHNQKFNGLAEMKHDIAVYAGTLIVSLMPLLRQGHPNLTDLIQIGITYIVLVLTKRLYWQKEKYKEIV